MRSTFFPQCVGHQCHFHGSDHAPEIEEIWLDDLKSIISNQPSKSMETIFLLASGNRNCKCIGNLLGFFIPVERDRFLKKLETILF